MDMIGAAEESMKRAEVHRAFFDGLPPECGFSHLQEMASAIRGEMSDAKRGRWLGWMQACIVVACHPRLTLDDMKQINRDYT